MDFAATHPSLFSHDERRPALTALAVALVFGALTQALFWRASFGLNFWIWEILVVTANVLAFRRGKIGAAAWGAISACVLLGFSIVRFASDWPLVVAVPANLTILAALPVLLRDRLTLSELAGVPWNMILAIGYAPKAVMITARLPGRAFGGGGGTVLRGIFRGLMFGVPTAGFFALLLSPDDDFSRLVARARDEIGEGALFAIMSLVTSTGYLVNHALHTSAHEDRLAAEQVAEHRAATAVPYRFGESPETLASPRAALGRVSTITWGMILGQVALVFGIFVAANLRHLFGGHALVRAQGAVTYSSYLHAGFAQLLFASILSVCLVLVGHALLRSRDGGALGSAVPGGARLATIEAALLVLTGVTVASCWQRLQIYEDAYGASHLRLGVAIVELAVLGVLVLTLAKVVFRRWRGHGGALLAFAAMLSVFASAIDADAYVALKNLDRAAQHEYLDEEYLVRLSPDAKAALDHPYVKADRALEARLRASYCAPRNPDLRAFRGLGSCAASQ